MPEGIPCRSTHGQWVSRKNSQARTQPLVGIALGPDKKGRCYLELPSGKALHFYGGIAGETVRVRRGRRGRRGEQGDLLEVMERDALRREARCSHFGVCGGCTMQQMPEASALAQKTEPLYRHLASRFPEAKAHAPVPSPSPFAYRTKVELSFLRESDGVTRLGFHRRGRFDKLVDVHRCWLSGLRPEVIEGLRLWASRHGLVGWDGRRGGGDLRYLLYRRSSTSGDDLLALVVQSTAVLSPVAREDLVQLLQQAGVRGALLLWQSSPAGAIVAEAQEPLYGPQTLLERLGELEFELGWKSFFQINPPAYLSLLQTMRAWRLAPAGSRILDLFCGVGSIGLFLTRPGDELTGVESVEEAVVDARASALRNGIPARFEAVPAEDWGALEADLLLLDPPRSGCHPRLLKLLRERAPAPEMFYVSCNPHRLQEELDDLSASFRLLSYQAFDFFPQTHHAEMLLHFQALEST